MQNPDASRRAPIRSTGPWNLIENRPHLGDQVGLGGSALVWGAKYMLAHGDWLWGHGSNATPPPPPGPPLVAGLLSPLSRGSCAPGTDHRTVVGNGLTDGQWWSRNFYDLLVSMCCKFLNLNDMTNKKVFVTGKMTLTVSRTQTLSFLDKSCAVRSCIHHKFNAI